MLYLQYFMFLPGSNIFLSKNRGTPSSFSCNLSVNNVYSVPPSYGTRWNASGTKIMFYELHTRSAFSFLSSGSQPQRLAQRVAELGMPGAALIDRDTVAGAVRFHFEAKKHGIKPIIGAEITMDDGSLLPLVPIDLGGYQNLSKLITTIKLRHKKGEHFATRKDIEQYSATLYRTTAASFAQ